MVIAVDFDGTCVTHEFPNIGKEIGAAPVLRTLVKNGHLLILNTMRSPRENRDVLKEAVDWFKSKDIPLFDVNKNPEQKDWTSSPKAYANIYIDDAALGTPLVTTIRFKPFIDWIKISYLLFEKGLITEMQLRELIPLIVQDLEKL